MTTPSLGDRPPLRIGLIGFGAIGATVWRELLGAPDRVSLVGLLLRADPNPGRPGPAAARAAGVPLVHDIDALMALGPQVVLECAGHAAVDTYGEPALRAGADLVVVSAGALAQADRHDRLLAAARDTGRQVIVPAGAIGGLEFLSAVRLAGPLAVRYRSRKPPAAWRGTPADTVLDLDSLREPAVFYRGNAREAARDYPRNANVAATLALATLGFERTEVELMADPAAGGNLHEIEAVSDVGSITIRIEGRVSPDNPRTSMVTPYSVVRAVLNRREALLVG